VDFDWWDNSLPLSLSSLSLPPSPSSPSFSQPLLFPFLPSPLPLEVGPPLNPASGLGERCKLCWSAVSSPSGVWGGAPTEIEFGSF